MSVKPKSDKGGREVESIETCGFSPLSPMLRVDTNGFTLHIRVHHVPHGGNEWATVQLGEARIPPTPLWGQASKLRNHPEYFWTIAATLDTYLLRQVGSKSTHLIAIDIVNTLVKIVEFSLLKGFYRLQDVPKTIWLEFGKKLAKGRWVKVLDVENRVVEHLAIVKDIATQVRNNNKGKGHWSIRSELLDSIGTNVASTELAPIRNVLDQALKSSQLAAKGDFSKYKRVPAEPIKRSLMLQYLRPLNMMADTPQPWGLSFVPIPDVMAFVNKYGKPNGRTENFDPATLASLLMYSYRWVLDYGPATVDLLSAFLVQCSAIYGPDAREQCGAMQWEDQSWSRYQSKHANLQLQQLPERAKLEELMKKRIHSIKLKRTDGDTISINAILDEIYSSCFCILAIMNGRRKDELTHSAIGMARNGLHTISSELGLFEFYFYVEKTFREYIPFYVNDISRITIDLLDSLSQLSLGWAQLNNPLLEFPGEADKLFLYPNVTQVNNGRPTWFAFNAKGAGKSSSFVAKALGSKGVEMRVSPHMFRRAYGVIFIYRYEFPDLVALAQQYGHFDVKGTLTYVTDSIETELDKSLAALWSAPDEVITQARKAHVKDLQDAIQLASIARIKDLVAEIVIDGQRFGGGFARLVSRFHARLGKRLDYSSLSSKKQATALSDALLARGHVVEPLRHASCMSGDVRRGAACSDSKGKPQRHIAAPELCGSCPYSLMAKGHLQALKQDEARLAASCKTPADSIMKKQDVDSLQALRRVIILQSQRLGIA